MVLKEKIKKRKRKKKRNKKNCQLWEKVDYPHINIKTVPNFVNVNRVRNHTFFIYKNKKKKAIMQLHF